MVSRIPPASPAAIMFVNSGSKLLGCFFIASASDAPLSTSPRVARIVAEKFLSSSCEPSISRHCTSGSPASIMTENCRVNTARFLGFAFLPSLPFLTPGTAFSFAAVMRVTITCSRRSAATAASAVSATRSPLMASPPRVRPENANVGIVVPSLKGRGKRGEGRKTLFPDPYPSPLTPLPSPLSRGLPLHRPDAPRHARTRPETGALDDAHTARDHLVQLFLQ